MSLESGSESGEDRATFRITGRLETLNPEIEPLPPTPISEKAEQSLSAWGVPNEYQRRLQELTSSFRYDLSTKKAESLIKRDTYIRVNPQGRQEVVLSGIYDYNRSLDGECSQLAIQELNQLNFSGYLNELNEELQKQGKPELKIYVVSGQARTHFADENDTHVWLGILPEDRDRSEMVIIDPSFQEISEGSGYVAHKTIDAKYGIVTPLSQVVEAGPYIEDTKGNPTAVVMDHMTLGCSSDRKYCYLLGFASDLQTGTPHPAISVQSADGGVLEPTALLTNNGSVKWINLKGTLDEQYIKEAESIVTTLRSMPITFDQQKADAAAAWTYTIAY
jgi:hypothetical protein